MEKQPQDGIHYKRLAIWALVAMGTGITHQSTEFVIGVAGFTGQLMQDLDRRFRRSGHEALQAVMEPPVEPIHDDQPPVPLEIQFSDDLAEIDQAQVDRMLSYIDQVILRPERP